jgi:hypothetical protein
MFGWFSRKKLDDVLNETKRVRIQGVVFVIRRINVLDYLNGSRVLTQSYDTYKTAGEKQAALTATVSDEKIKRHYGDVLVSGVVRPRIVFKKEDATDPAVEVETLLTNWDMAERLYSEIMEFTYGKKKLRQAILAAKGLPK